MSRSLLLPGEGRWLTGDASALALEENWYAIGSDASSSR